MKPYGRRNPTHSASNDAYNHQHCAICHPDDVSKARARRDATLAITDGVTDYETTTEGERA